MAKLSERSRAVTMTAMGFVMLFLVPPGMLFDGHRKADLLARLHREGRHAIAYVESTPGTLSRSSNVTYTFKADGKQYRRIEEVSGDVMAQARRAETLDVYYSVVDPMASTVDPWKLDRSSKALLSWGPWFAGTFGLTCLGIGITWLRRLN